MTTNVSTEAGGQASFTVVLNSQPTANVTVNYHSSDTTEGTVSPASVTFTPLNWSSPQTVLVTGQDDAVADGNRPYSIVFDATVSTDTAYAAITPANIALSNTDNDTASINVTVTDSTSSEAGGQASFTVVLNSEPTANVTVNYHSSDTTEGTVSPASVTFTPLNWSSPQTVMVTGQDDLVADGNRPYNIVFDATGSSDAAYAAITPANIALSNTDNDTASINVTATDSTSSEAGGQASFDIVLNSEPTANVTVNYHSSDTTEGTVSPASVTFTPLNWSSPQTVLVTGQDDAVADGNSPYDIVFDTTSSADAAYAALTPANIALSNTDNDTASINVTVTTNVSTEAGGQASFTVVLNSEPTANVTVNYHSSNTAEGTVSPASVAFTPLNWSSPQTVMVTGQDDAVADGNRPYNIVFDATVSTDTAYAAITPANIALSNTDNDTASINVTVTDNTSSEAGGQASFTVVLNSEPTANVTVNYHSSDTTEGTVSPASVTFTPLNWSSPQTVTGDRPGRPGRRRQQPLRHRVRCHRQQ